MAACVVDLMLYYEQAIWRVSSKPVRYAPPLFEQLIHLISAFYMNPTDKTAADIVSSFTAEAVLSTERLKTGNQNYVYSF